MDILKTIIRYIALSIHTIINRKTIILLKTPLRVFYYYWVAAEFKTCGKNCVFGGFSQLTGAKKIILGNNLYIGKDIVWELYEKINGQTFHPILTIGDNSSFGDGGHITCINEIRIGNGVRIGRKVFITDNSHGDSVREMLKIPANLRPLVSKGPVVIEDNAWIGEMACIMPRVKIGKGAIVAANSVVTKDVPPYSVVAGSPANVVKQL